MESDRAVSFCGLDCSRCPVFCATQKGDAPLRKRTARSWSRLLDLNLTEADMVCEGCRSAVTMPHSARCEIRACCAGRNMENCSVCADRTSCKRMDDFWRFFEDHRSEFLWRDSTAPKP